jgi:hypothetical protein
MRLRQGEHALLAERATKYSYVWDVFSRNSIIIKGRTYVRVNTPHWICKHGVQVRVA